MSAAAERIEEILLEAERAADQIQHDAVAEAERYLAQRRHEAEIFVSQQLDRLQAELDRFRQNVAGAEPADGPKMAAAEEAPAQVPDGESHDEALIRATQLAVQGTRRDEIVATLRREFARADPEAIVAEILD